MNSTQVPKRISSFIYSLMSLVVILTSSVSRADYEYTHGKWVLNPAETVERRSQTYPLNAEGKAKLLADVSAAITWWELDGANLTYTDNHGKVSGSPYLVRPIDAKSFEMVFVVDGNAVGGAIRIEPSDSGFCATFVLDHASASGQLKAHADCYQRDDR